MAVVLALASALSWGSGDFIAGRLDTINYEVTCGISARVPRRPA